MPSVQTVSRITIQSWADSQAVKGWRDKARVQAISALSLANKPDYIVYAVRNSRDTLLGLAAIRENAEDVQLLHLASRDVGRGIGSLLICEIDKIYDKRIKTVPETGAISFYEYIGWRKVGKEYWSR
jgi:hypothetical protein